MTELLHLLNPENTGIFNRTLAHAIGLNEAIMYSSLVAKLVYYQNKNLLDDDGYFYATADDIQESTCLTRRQQDSIIDNLVKTGLIEVKVKGMPARRHFKVFCNPGLLKQLLQNGIEKIEEIKEKSGFSFNKTSKQVLTKSENKIEQNVETSFNKMSKHDSTKSENMFQQNVEENIRNKHKIKNISNKTYIRKVSENLPAAAPPPTEKPKSNVETVFDYWKTVMKSPRSILDDSRKEKIKEALKKYSVESLLRAIDGCACSPFHMGENKNGMKYNSISLIFRNPEKIEQFMGYVDKPPKAKKSESIEEQNARNKESIFGPIDEPYTIIQ